MKYKIFYKCQMCGIKFFKEEDPDSFSDEDLITMFSKCTGELHNCEEGVIGYGKIAGIMKMDL